MVNGDPGSRAWGARVLAPLAFFAAASVLVLLVHRSLSADTEGGSAPTATQPAATEPARQTRDSRDRTITVDGAPSRRFYRIRTGDTLETIARRFDTTVDDLLTLNPGVEANSLTPGQRIRIR